jgi:hypothetical protein
MSNVEAESEQRWKRGEYKNSLQDRIFLDQSSSKITIASIIFTSSLLVKES